MPAKSFNLRLDAYDELILDLMAADSGQSRQEVLRALLHANASKYVRSAEATLVDYLLSVYGSGATLSLAFTGATPGDLELAADVVPGGGTDELAGVNPAIPFGQVCRLVEHRDTPGRVAVELSPVDDEEPDAGARVFVGVLPLQPSASLRVKLLDLHPVGSGS